MTLGIVGLGRIGKRMAHIGRNVFKRVVACDPYIIDGDFPAFVERRGLAELFAESDVVSLHVPLNAETRGMIDAKVLGGGEARAPFSSTPRAAPSSTSTPRSRRSTPESSRGSVSTCCRRSPCRPARGSSAIRG